MHLKKKALNDNEFRHVMHSYKKKSGVKQPHDFHYKLPQIFKTIRDAFSLLLLTEDSFSQSGEKL